eukprot:991513-Amphidinium_carterae.1
MAYVTEISSEEEAQRTLMDVEPALVEPGTPPSGQSSSSAHAPQLQAEPDIAPDDDEAPPPQTVLPAALQLHRSTGGEITLRCNYLTTRGAYRYQVRSKPPLIGQDKKTQLAALQAWLRAHEPEITEDSTRLLRDLLAGAQLQRQQEATAPVVRPEPPQSHATDSERLTWDQYRDILAWLVPTQRHLPKALQATNRTPLPVIRRAHIPVIVT